MVDRVSSYQLNTRSIQEMTKAQAQLFRTQEQISTGRRVLNPSDDPIASTRILQLNEEISMTDQYMRNIQLGRSRINEEEAVIQGVQETILHIRTVTVAAGNGARSYSDRQAYSAEVKQRVEELFDLFNYKDSTGEYLFSGFSGRTQPFVENPGGGYRYEGDEGRRYVQVSDTVRLPTSDTGKSLFVDIPANKTSFFAYAGEFNQGQPPGVIAQGLVSDQEKLDAFYPDDLVVTFNNELDVDPQGKNFTVRRRSDNRVVEGLENRRFVSGEKIEIAGMLVSITGAPVAGDSFVVETSTKQGVLTSFERLLFGLERYTDDPVYKEAFETMIADTLENLDNCIQNVSEVRSDIGARLNTLDKVDNLHQDLKLVSQGILSELRDLDFAEAVSRLEGESLVLQAAQQSYAKVQGLSLFNYI